MNKYRTLIMACSCLVLAALFPLYARAHCDTLDGPVVASARAALEKGDITPVLKWVKGDDEKEVKEVFQKVLAARKASPGAREIADMYFFETLVRIHRAGEGAPYTGLRAGPVEPIILEADKSLEAGSIEAVVKHITALAAKGIEKRFSQTLDRKKYADESVAAGRDFVEAYVEFTHYLERLYNDAAGHAAAHGTSDESKAKGGHGHGH
ncbi:MAG TPA: DUF6448 family protein [Syntrophorhabdaceae bacterium]